MKLLLLKEKKTWLNLDQIVSISFFQPSESEVRCHLEFVRSELDDTLDDQDTGELVEMLGLDHDAVMGSAVKKF